MLSSLSLSQELYFKSSTKSMDVEPKYTYIWKKYWKYLLYYFIY